MTKINGTSRNIMEWHWFVKWESGRHGTCWPRHFFSRTHDFVTSMGHDLKAVKDPKSNLTFLVPGPDLRLHAVTMQSPCECFDFQCSEPTSVVAQWNATRDVNKVFKCQIWCKGSRCSRVTWVRSSEYLTYLTVFDIFKCVYQTGLSNCLTVFCCLQRCHCGLDGHLHGGLPLLSEGQRGLVEPSKSRRICQGRDEMGTHLYKSYRSVIFGSGKDCLGYIKFLS